MRVVLGTSLLAAVSGASRYAHGNALGHDEMNPDLLGMARVERAFRSLKTSQLQVRPLHAYSGQHVRGHVFLCMLAYYVEWHLRRKQGPLLCEDCECAEGVVGGAGAGHARGRGQGGHESDTGGLARVEPQTSRHRPTYI